MKKQILASILACSLAFGTVAAPAFADNTATASLIDMSDMFSKRDSKTDYDASEAVAISLEGDTASCESDAVTVDGSTVTITNEGVYVLSGQLNGMVIVNAGKEQKVQLVLDGASIASETSAALYVLQADKVFVTLAQGTENSLSNGGEFVAIDDNDIDAALFSKEDLTLNGDGTLTVSSPAGHGVVSKDDLAVTGGTYVIDAAGQGLSGKDSVRILSGDFTITAGKDGIRSKNSDDEDKGFVAIAGGAFTITAGGDGISASGLMQIDDGEFNITAGGGSANAAAHSGDWGGFGQGGFRSMDSGEASQVDDSGLTALGMPGRGGQMPGGQQGGRGGQQGGHGGQMPGGQQGGFGGQTPDGQMPELPDGEIPDMPDGQMPDMGGDQRQGRSFGGWGGMTAESSDDSVSCKGVKAGTGLVINGGTFALNTADDAIHTNGSATINGGSFDISTGDDGVHADEDLTVNDCDMTISESYEGLEGTNITLNGGNITLTASDDGLNAAGGNDQSGFGGWGDRFGGADSSLTINGGTLTVNAQGDGLDSNGALTVNGGTIYVSGPTNSGNGALDCGSSASVNGGTVVAVGASGMAVGFGGGSSQGSIMVNVSSQQAGSAVTLTDKDGNVLVSFTPEKAYQNVVVSCPGLTVGGAYTLTAGSYAQEITLSSVSYGASGGMGMGGMGGRRW